MKITNKFDHESYLIEGFSQLASPAIKPTAIIAIDEVGRGCLAGPVVACVSLWVDKKKLHSSHQLKKQKWLSEIKDSKKIPEKKRKNCFDSILSEFELDINSIPIGKKIPDLPENLTPSNHSILYHKILKKNNLCLKFECVQFALGISSPTEIDQYNIWNSVQLASARALNKLIKVSKYNVDYQRHIANSIILMDGKTPIKVTKSFQNHLQINCIGADDIFVSVGFSSIVAKVFRDNLMINLGNSYPLYGFDKHKGYGTTMHFKAIQESGTTPLHRASFLKNYILKSTNQ